MLPTKSSDRRSGGEYEGLRGRPNFIGAVPAFLDLVDYERMLPKVWGILGWNIFLYHSHLIITEQTEGKFDPAGKTFGWHQDSVGSISTWRPILGPDFIKGGIFLDRSHCAGPGNFWIIPGSHLRNKVEMPPDGIGQPRARFQFSKAGHRRVFRPAPRRGRVLRTWQRKFREQSS